MTQSHLLLLLLPLFVFNTVSALTPLPTPYLLHPLKPHQQQQRVLLRPTTTKTTTALHATPTTSKVKFYVSNQSLQHLQSITNNFGVYKPPPWTIEKSIAVAGVAMGAILAGTVGHFLGENLNWLDTKAVTILLAFVGGGIGWTIFGGEKISRIDMAEDGGTQVKFIVDRPERLQHIVDTVKNASLDLEIVSTSSSNNTNDEKEDGYKEIAERYIQSIHTKEYLTELIDATNDSASMAKPRRLYPRYARTMIDGQSYDAALHCVMDWIHAVDTVTTPESGSKGSKVVPFVLTRPPSHHATKRQGMGGCLLNSIGIAAKYALDTHPTKINTVAILDIDAHHGNGIADCVSDEPNIRYCSLHEYDGSGGIGDVTYGNVVNPRSPSKDDVGPIGNLKNVILEPGTDWTKYEIALRNEAIPFLLELKPDLILVAAGFDALDADFTSSLRLQIDDYEKIGNILKETFGEKIVFGLEGGYTWRNGELGDAVISLVRPWCV